MPGGITSRLRPTVAEPAALPRSCSRRPNLPSSHVSSGTPQAPGWLQRVPDSLVAGDLPGNGGGSPGGQPGG
jgi:hypothetical protein